MRVNEIDLLRFSAALMVVLFHYIFRGYTADAMSPLPYPSLVPAAKYGYLGVELFFLISGFVILMTASAGSLRKFVVSRLVRLYPAYWVCVTLTFVMILAVGAPRFGATFGQYLANLTMLNEFVHIPSIDGVYWSLAVELKFYALVALVLAAGLIARAELLLAGWLAVAALLDAVDFSYTVRSLLVTEFAPFFVAGALCYLVYANGMTLLRGAVIACAWLLALRGSIAAIPILERQFREPFDPVVIGVLVSAFFAVMVLVAVKRTGWFARRGWVAIGALTYPLYLIHQKAGYMIFNLAWPAVNAHVLLWGTVALMLGVAWLVNRYVERRYSKAFKLALEKLFSRAAPERAAPPPA